MQVEKTAAQPRQLTVGEMFDGRSVFITGASGFIGRVLLEKLLRSYPGIERIYILLRSKKNQLPQERLHKHILSAPIFDAIRAMDKGEQLFDKIVVIPGDISEPNLGIGESDLSRMLSDETLSIVFHSAATIKFDEPLKVSVKLNLIATKTIISLCKRLPNLVSLCHVSTAYVNSDIQDQSVIEEKLYPMRDDPEHLIKVAELMDENLMQNLKVSLVDKRPNTYTYTKALAEHLIATEAGDLPVAIVRPTIVVASWKEPFKGWIDNLNGATGLLLAVGKGLCRTLNGNPKNKAEVIPVDVVVNTMVAAAFYVAKTNGKLPASDVTTHLGMEKKLTSESVLNNEQQLPIFHCNSGDVNPLTWGKVEEMFSVIRAYPSVQVLRYPLGTLKSNRYHDLITRVFVHLLPALLIDSLCAVFGKKRQLLSIYSKLHAAIDALNHFTTRNYNFQTKNVRLLENQLTESDREDLFMDIRSLDWYSFWHDYNLGIRRYILREPDSTLEVARKSLGR